MFVWFCCAFLSPTRESVEIVGDSYTFYFLNQSFKRDVHGLVLLLYVVHCTTFFLCRSVYSLIYLEWAYSLNAFRSLFHKSDMRFKFQWNWFRLMRHKTHCVAETNGFFEPSNAFWAVINIKREMKSCNSALEQESGSNSCFIRGLWVPPFPNHESQKKSSFQSTTFSIRIALEIGFLINIIIMLLPYLQYYYIFL